MRFGSNNLRRVLVLVSVSAALAACGGGGGGMTDGGPGGGSGGGGSTPAGDRYAILTWDAPTQNEDGTPLSDLQAYRVGYGLSPGLYSDTASVDVSEMSCNGSGAAQTCTFMVENLGVGSWYFAVQAVDADGNVSAYSNEVVKTVE